MESVCVCVRFYEFVHVFDVYGDHSDSNTSFLYRKTVEEDREERERERERVERERERTQCI